MADQGDNGDQKLMNEPANHFKPRDGAGYVGLDNQGMTCYMNSLIQTFYMTPKLREGLFMLNDEELGVEYLGQEEEDEPPEHEVKQLTNMGFHKVGAKKALKKHPGDLMAAIEFLSTYDPSSDPDAQKPEKKGPKKKAWKIPIALRRLFARLKMLDQRSDSTKDLTDSFGWKGNQAMVQHDIHELNRKLLEALEGSMKTTKLPTLCNDLYRGTQIERRMCTVCGYMSENKSTYMDINVTVQGQKNIVDSLKNNTFTVLHGRDQYRCPRCGKVDAVYSNMLLTLPPVMTFLLGRFYFNRKTMRRQKDISRFAFPLEIDMAPYLDVNDFKEQAMKFYKDWKADREKKEKEEAKRKAAEEVRKAAKAAENSKLPYNGDLKAAIKAKDKEAKKVIMEAMKKRQETSTKGEASEKETQESKKDSGESLAGELKAAVAARDKLMENPVDLSSSHIYELKSVMIHIGTAFSGHYHAYICENDKDVSGNEEKDVESAQWFDFNDHVVSNIPTEQISKQYGGADETAYVLVYAKKGTWKETGVKIPENVRKEIEELNKSAVERRKKYTTLINRVTLRLHPGDMYKVEEDFFTANPTSKAKPVSVVIDRRVTLEEAKKLIAEKMELKDTNFSLNILRTVEGLDGLQCGKSLDDDKKTLEKMGVSKYKSTVLLWDGKTINGTAFKPNPDIGKFMIKLIYYKSDDEPQDVRLAVPHDCTFGDLAQALHEKLGLPNDHEKIMYHLMFQGIDPIIMPLKKDIGVPIKSTGIVTKSVILGVELNTGQTSDTSVTNAWFCEASNKVTLQVSWKNKTTAINLIRAGTIGLLKNMIKKAVSDLPESFCLRRMLGKGKEGCIIKDNNATLKTLGLTEENTELKIEAGEGLKSNEIEILYNVHIGRNLLADRVPITLPLSTTIEEFKAKVLDKPALKEISNIVSVFKTKGDAHQAHLGVYGKDASQMIKDEKLTLEETGLCNGDSLWLGESKRSVDGWCQLKIFHFIDHEYKSLSKFQSEREELKEMIAKGGEVDKSMYMIEETVEKLPYGGDIHKAMKMRDTSAIRKIMEARKKPKKKEKKTTELKEVFKIPFHNDLSLADLKSTLFHHPLGTFKNAKSAKHLRLFTLKPNSLVLSDIIRSNRSSLLSQGVIGDMEIAVQVMPSEDPEVSIKSIALKLLRCYKAYEVEAKALKAAKPKEEKKKDTESEEQARKRAKTEHEVPCVFGPVPPPYVFCDAGEVKLSATTTWNPWDSMESLQKALEDKELSKHISITTLPVKTEEKFRNVVKSVVKSRKAPEITGKYCTLADLRRTCEKVSGTKDPILLKWFDQAQRWHVLSSNLSEKLFGNDQTKVQNPNKEEVLMASPFRLRDGDFIAVLDKSEFGAALDETAIDEIIGSLGPRSFITSRRAQQNAVNVQKVPEREQGITISW